MKMKTVEMERYKLGKHGPLVSKFGLGGVAMSDLFGHDRNDEESLATLRRAAAVHPISDLQIEYSLFSRGIEDAILPTARELGRRDLLS